MENRKASTAALIERCINKDTFAWAEFVRRFSPLITFSARKTLLKYLNNKLAVSEKINDVEQEIMTLLWSENKLTVVRNKENIDYWLAILSHNVTIDYLRSQKKEILIDDENYFDTFPSSVTHEILDNSGAESADDEITLAYKALSSREKVIFKLYFKKNLALADIAKLMRIPLGTVSSIITRMRKKIKKYAAK